MYCSKCGTELPGEVKFCPSCGTGAGEAPKSSSETPTVSYGSVSSSLSTKPFWIASVAGSILMIILSLVNWVKFTGEAYSIKSSITFSLFSIIKIMRNIRLINEDHISIVGCLFTFVLFVLWIAAVATMAVFCYSLFMNKNKCIFWGKIAMNAAIVLSVLSIVLIFITDKVVSGEMYGVDFSMSTTFVPFFVGVLAIAGRVYLIKKLKEELSMN